MALIKCKECGADVSTKAQACPACGAKVRHTSMFTKIVGGFFSIVILMSIFSNSSDEKTQAAATPKPKSQKELAAEGLNLKINSWSTGGFSNVMLLSFTITNSSDISIKDFEILCEHSGKSGTKMDSNKRVIYETIPAHGKLQKREFNMGFIHSQADSTNCRITDFSIA